MKLRSTLRTLGAGVALALLAMSTAFAIQVRYQVDLSVQIALGNFNPTTLDGKGTNGLALPKSNWARRIDEKDLHCYPVMCANTFTCGGVKITKDGEVVNRDGYPIPGLWAAGETVGMYYGLYVGATSVLRGLVFGRRAGQKIAALAKARK